jgi:hypothetical protein
MADVFSLLRAYLMADATISGLVGPRIYPIKPPQAATFPLVTMQQIAEESFPHKRGGGIGGIEKPHYQIDAWVREAGVPAFEKARELARAVRARLDGFSGVLAEGGESYRVDIQFETARDLFEENTGGGFYRRSSDYVIGHRPVTT